MMKVVLLAFWLIAATPLSAGVALDMVTKDASGLTIEVMKV